MTHREARPFELSLKRPQKPSTGNRKPESDAQAASVDHLRPAMESEIPYGSQSDHIVTQGELVAGITLVLGPLLHQMGFGTSFSGTFGTALHFADSMRSKIDAPILWQLYDLDVALTSNIYSDAAEWYIENSQPLPPWLSAHLLTVLREHRKQREAKRGRPAQNAARDFGLALAVLWVCAVTHLKPTRNDATSEPSGSAVVAAALAEVGYKLSEKSVARIWNQFMSGRAHELSEFVSMTYRAP